MYKLLLPFKQLALTVIVLCSGFLSNSLYGQVEAIATCPGVAADSMFQIKITGFSGNPYTIIVDGVVESTNAVQAGDYTSGNFAFVDGTQTIEVSVIENPTTTADSVGFLVHEVFCVDIDQDGSYDFSGAVCDYMTPDIETRGSVISTVAPYLGENVYNYVLTDTLGIAISSNNTGYFPNIADGSYNVFAFTFLTQADANQMVDSLTFGTTDMDGFSLTQPACYGFCGDVEGKTGSFYVVECDLLVIAADIDDQTICYDEDVDFNVPTTITGVQPPLTTVAYEWLVDSTGTGFLALAGDTDSVLNLTAVPVEEDGNEYQAIAILLVNGVEIDRDTSAAGTLTVNEAATLAMNMDTTVSSGSSIGVVFTDGNSTADSFVITAITIPTIVPATDFVANASNATIGSTLDASEISGDSYINDTGAPVTVTYTVTPFTSDGCSGPEETISVTISPCPEVDPIMVIVCSDDLIAVSLPATDVNGATIDSFLITANSAGATTGLVTATNTIQNDTYNNITSGDSTVIYTITPYAFGCAGSDFTITVTVKPEPVVNDQIVSACSDETIGVDLMELAGYAGPSVDSFVVTAVVGPGLTGTASEGTFTTNDGIANDEFTNIASTLDSVVYTVTPWADGCVGADYTITVRIISEPVGSDPALVTCSDESFSVTLQDLISNSVSVDSFAWYAAANANVSGVPTDTSNNTTLSGVLTNISGSSEDVVYTVVPYMGSCGGDPFDVTVTVNPEPVFTNTTELVCSDEEFSIVLGLTQTDGSTILGYNYTVNAPGTARTDTSAGNIIETIENTTASDITLTYVVTPMTADRCEGNTFEIVVTVQPEPVFASTGLLDTICSGAITGYTFIMDAGSVAADSFNIISITDGGLTNSAASPATAGLVKSASAISDDSWVNNGTSSVNVTYNVAPVSVNGCEGDPVDIVITVDPDITVTIAGPYTLCSNYDLTLSELSPTITGGTTAGTWSTNGTGTFVDGSDAGDSSFGGAVTYKPSLADKQSGGVILTLTSDAAGECSSDSDSATITINNVTCSEFPWTGN